MNISGNEIAAGKRRLEEVLPQVPVAVPPLKPIEKPVEKTGENVQAVQPSQTLAKTETQQILKRFEPLVPVLQKALQGTQVLRQEIQSLKNLTKPTPRAAQTPLPPPSVQVPLRVEKQASRVPVVENPVPKMKIGSEEVLNPPEVAVAEKPRGGLAETRTPPVRLEEEADRPALVNPAPRTSSKVQAANETKPPAGLVLRPAISPISGRASSATLGTQGQTSKPLMIPAAGGELSPTAVRERTLQIFQQRLRQQQPQVLSAEVRQAVRDLQTHTSNAILPLERTAQEPKNIGLLRPREAKPETVARTPFHRDNGPTSNVNGQEITVQAPEVNRPRLTPPARGITAPPLSNLNQLRRPLPTNTRSRLVALPSVNILDLVL